MLGNGRALQKYIDLVKSATDKYANWDPSIPISAGDYGSINRLTGQFERHGNIYREEEIRGITSNFPPATGPEVDDYQILSTNARKVKVGPEVHATFLGTIEPVLEGQWRFSYSRGALLLIHKQRITLVPPELLEKLRSSGWAKGRQVVTQVHNCQAYALYLSDKSSETVSISLHVDASNLATPGVTVGAGATVIWTTEGVTGILQKAINSEPVFTPLYQIKEVGFRAGRRDQALDPKEDQVEEWQQVEASWDFLNEDGEEETEE
ncbi:uncharacterized protein FOMMEDRAFT_36211, partial [Fomitiporia mediterranea MF3/22]